MKRYIAIILIFTALLTACGGNSEELTELWVVTEQSEGEGMSYQAELMAQQFESEHPGITVLVDILPTSEESRAAYLQKIRAEVMSGGGPDVYLMPTGAQLPPAEANSSTPYLEPLYHDVARQMYNGIFTDISEYYDADTELTTGLVESIMEGGVMDGDRYVIPLRFRYDALMVDLDAAAEMGIDPTVFEGGVDDLYNLALELNDEIAAHPLNIIPSWYLLPDTIDHQTENIKIDTIELENLIKNWQAVVELENIEAHQNIMGYYGNLGWLVEQSGYPGYVCDIDSYIFGKKKDTRFFSTAGYPFYLMDITDCVEAAATIKQSQENIVMYPVRAADGSLVAEITYYGAIGSGCRNPELAYEFLRLFLTENAQWEQYSSETVLLDIGFPVRTAGWGEMTYEKIRKKLQRTQYLDIQEKRMTYVPYREKFIDENFVITDADIPLFSVSVDEGRFPVITENGEFFDQYLNRLVESDDLSEQIQQMIDDLQWLITEG